MRDIKIFKSHTNRNEESLSRYLSDIAQINLLSPQEEAMLARKIQEGDKAAEDKLITGNLRFVVSCAKKYQHHGMSLPDLVCEGNLGLIKAARLFDETRGFKFISYAVWWIRQAMLIALNEHKRIIRLPMNQQLGMTQFMNEASRLEQQLERTPSIAEVAEVCGKKESQLADFVYHNSHIGYLEDPIPGTGLDENTLLGFLPDQTVSLTHDWIQKEALESGVSILLDRLKERDRKVITLAFGLLGEQQLDNEDIADRLDLSVERIRQLKQNAILYLRSLPGVNKLKAYA